jgi:hypothetical protein
METIKIIDQKTQILSQRKIIKRYFKIFDFTLEKIQDKFAKKSEYKNKAYQKDFMKELIQ